MSRKHQLNKGIGGNLMEQILSSAFPIKKETIA